MPLLRRVLQAPFVLTRDAFDMLPTETQTHARAAVDEGIAALRSLADGATDATERAIDRIAVLISRQ
jgi:hypothetical protein